MEYINIYGNHGCWLDDFQKGFFESIDTTLNLLGYHLVKGWSRDRSIWQGKQYKYYSGGSTITYKIKVREAGYFAQANSLTTRFIIAIHLDDEESIQSIQLLEEKYDSFQMYIEELANGQHEPLKKVMELL